MLVGELTEGGLRPWGLSPGEQAGTPSRRSDAITETVFLQVENGTIPPSASVERASPTGQRPDLAACDREPIHIVGSIQPHGFMLVVDVASLTIVQASENAAPHAAVGATLTSSLPEVAALVSRHLDGMHDQGTAAYLRTVRLASGGREQAYEVAAHRVGRLAVVELEEVADAADGGLDTLYPRLRAFVERLHEATSIEELCALAAADIRHFTGFDRVLVYRFDEDWHGTVLAEDGNGVLPSYLDLRFPASDIPAQARELYRRNRLRIIPDAGYAPVPVVPALTPDGAAARPQPVGAAQRLAGPPRVHAEHGHLALHVGLDPRRRRSSGA